MINETLILKIYYNICAILGVVPHGSPRVNLFFKYPLMTFLVALGFYVIYSKIIDFDGYDVLLLCTDVLYLCFSATHLYELYYNKYLWNKLCVLLLYLDTTFGRIHVSKLLIFKHFSCAAALSCVLIAEAITFHSMLSLPCTLYRFIIDIQIIAVTILIFEVCKRITKELETFCVLLENFGTTELLHRNETINTLKKFGRAYMNIYLINGYVNEIFGKTILIIILILCLKLVPTICFYTTIFFVNFPVNIIFVIDSSYLGTYIILVVLLVIAGDRIENCGKRTIRLFHVLQAHLQDPLTDNEIEDFTVLLEKLRPVLAAAGFINVNRRLFPILLSNITTYIIIMIQLNLYTISS
ncbi:uncharacterized protein LOC130898164 [Diorhabda carinulata]|uniref:uncharacterized protein LOC130898164 n=1 Tax=Diorhabda carinulata TaxID=1163345 RepID=UPI0025A037FE|nr:uncharacterized protein LOC130898164 [Diorhabda carinulata]